MHKKHKSFTLMEILLGSLIFVSVAIMATGIISSVVNARNKTTQQKNINTAAQKIFDEIGREIRDGNPKKQVYICSFDQAGQVVDWPVGAWGDPNQPPNDFVLDYISIPNPPFGEQIGSRRIGNTLQIVEFDAGTTNDTEVGWHNTSYQNIEHHITRVTQFSVEFLDNNGTQGTQIIKYLLDEDTINILEDGTGPYWMPCRNLEIFENHPATDDLIQTFELLPENISLIELNNPWGIIDIDIMEFIVEGCDDLKTNTDDLGSGPGVGYPDFGGEPITCPDLTTATDQSMYGPLIRISLGLQGGVEGPQSGQFTESVFRTSFQTRRILGN
ncbi:MAG: hypothetical protein ABH837_00685 [bacterium]